MRFLRQASREWLRLGWLRVISGLIGTRRVATEEIREGLRGAAEQSPRWIAEAGIFDPPTGKVSPTRAERLIGMGVTYGIYDKSTNSLTDLGHVLRHLAPWSAADNPFRWEGDTRWIGFWILMQAAGDVLFAAIRQFPEDGATNEALARLLSRILQDLARQVPSPDERKEILAHVRSGPDGRDTIFPYLEPLRELGYLQRHQKLGRHYYALTERGDRVKRYLSRSEVVGAGKLLRDGFSGLFLYGEGIESQHPATLAALRPVLAAIPEELMVPGRLEISLDVLVLLAQARLLSNEPGRWIDQTRALSLLREVEIRSGGRIYSKQGMLINEANVAWAHSDVVNDLSLWNESVEDADVRDSDESRTARAGESGEREEPSATAEASEPEEPREPSSREPDEIANPETGTPVEPMESAELARVVIDAGEPSVAGERLLSSLMHSSTQGSLRLWLEYVDALLEQPALGAQCVTRWGGVNAALVRLHSLAQDLPNNRFSEKRKDSKDDVLDPDGSRPIPPVVLHPLQLLRGCLSAPGTSWVASRVEAAWRGSLSRQMVKVAIERGIRNTHAVGAAFRTSIEAFLRLTGEDPEWKQWPLVSEMTRASIHDALALGLWSAEELRRQLYAALQEQEFEPLDAALRWLGLVFPSRKALNYIQRRSFVQEDAAMLGLDELVKMARENQLPPKLDVRGPLADLRDGADGQPPRYEFAVEVEASTSYEAKIQGRDRVHTLLVARYAQASRASGLDLVTSLFPEIPSFEEVQGADQELESLEVDDPTPTLLPSRQPLGRVQDLFASNAWVRRGAPDNLQRVLRARRGLLLSKDPGRRPEERLSLAWAAVEQLIGAGEDSKSGTLSPLASAICLLHIPRSITRTYYRASRGLRIQVVLEPGSTLSNVLDVWFAEAAVEIREHMQLSLPARRAYLLKGVQNQKKSDSEALEFLLKHRDSLLAIRDGIMKYTPLASSGLHDFVFLTGDGKQPGNKVPPLGNGKVLAEHVSDFYRDTLSFISHVYELRNRFMHSGDGFDLSRETAAASDLYGRYVALIAPVLDVIQKLIEGGVSLEHAWDLSQHVLTDLTNIHNDKEVLSYKRLAEIWSFGAR